MLAIHYDNLLVSSMKLALECKRKGKAGGGFFKHLMNKLLSTRCNKKFQQFFYVVPPFKTLINILSSLEYEHRIKKHRSFCNLLEMSFIACGKKFVELRYKENIEKTRNFQIKYSFINRLFY